MERPGGQTWGGNAGCRSVPGWTAGKRRTVCLLGEGVMRIDVYTLTHWHHPRPPSVYVISSPTSIHAFCLSEGISHTWNMDSFIYTSKQISHSVTFYFEKKYFNFLSESKCSHTLFFHKWLSTRQWNGTESEFYSKVEWNKMKGVNTI